jgi:hypothetical protein
VTYTSRARRGKSVDNDPLAVDGDTHDTYAERYEQPAGRLIAWILHSHDVTSTEQDARDKVDRLLSAVGDHDVVSGQPESARRTKVPRNRLTQARVPGRMLVHIDATGIRV